MPLRVAITGATGNAGSALVERLRMDPQVGTVVGIARRRPGPDYPVDELVRADVAHDDLRAAFAGADVVVHLAWQIQPSRDHARLHATNVQGTRRVVEAALAVGVRRLVFASSIGVYSPGAKTRLVDESWPREGIPGSTYSLHKAEAERLLDGVEQRGEPLEIVRLRPALIFQRTSATEQRKLFAGPFVPGRVLRRGLLPILPTVPGLLFQAVHADDVAEAYRLAIHAPGARGAYNVASAPVLGMPLIAASRNARSVSIPRAIARPLFAAAYAARLHPSEPSWLDVGLDSPLVSADRIAHELRWQPRHTGLETINEVVDGLAAGDGGGTPPLARDHGLRDRLRELAQGVGRR